MTMNAPSLEEFAPDAFRFYGRAIEIMQVSGVPFLLGGAYALSHYTGIVRHTKDLDLFIEPPRVTQALAAFAAAGYRTEIVFSHWLGKVFHGHDFIDIIFSSGNGLCKVDSTWFEHAVDGVVLGARVSLMPVEEMIWQKAYIMERERFDGADVIHLLRARGRRLDWDRLLARFGSHWRVLLSHLVLFGFVYPHDRESVPARVLHALVGRLLEEPAETPGEPLCRGTLLSRTQYLADTEEWGYADPRLRPAGPMSEEQVVRWTDAGR
jgi:Nucleotidyl transferase of unknown function (DUF2204)